MTKERTLRFRKVTKYYFPDGSEFKDGFIAFYTFRIVSLIVLWIFFPIVWLSEYKGTKQTYYEEVKK